MSGLLSLSLLCAATFLQSSASADDCACTKMVCLKCNTTVRVEAGQAVTLKCSICSKDFIGTAYVWEEDAREITCNSSSMKYQCEWDNMTYVSLIISTVVEHKDYTVHIIGNGGRDESSIKVQVFKIDETIILEPTTMPDKKAFALLISIPLIASGILYFLFGTNRGKKIMKAMRKEKTQGDRPQ